MEALCGGRTGASAHCPERCTTEKARGSLCLGPEEYRPDQSGLRLWQHSASGWRRYLPIRASVWWINKIPGITESDVASRLSRDLEQESRHHRQQLSRLRP